MSGHAQAKPQVGPLPGGREGVTVSVEPIISGTVNWPLSLMESPGGRMLNLRSMITMLRGEPTNLVPVPAFLIRHPSAGPVLVDTGLHPSIASDPKQNLGALATRIARPHQGPGEDVPAQLRARGVDASSLATVVMTHLHFDHASGLSEFPNATIVVSATEWHDATTGGSPSLRGYRPAHYDFTLDFRTIDFDDDSVGSYASFGRTVDLFGDGSVRLAFTPGHSAGHMSVIAKLKDRDFLIAGDAIYTAAQLDGAPPPPRPFDLHNWKRSLRELKLYRTQRPNSIIAPGHDAAFYDALGPKYE